jgi:hypothetical protein
VRKHINSLSVLRFSNGLKILQRSVLPLLLILLANDVEMNPGPEGTPECVPPQQLDHNMRCLYFNARSLVNKTTEFQAIVTDFDIVAITETWLNTEIRNSELLPGQNFTIHRNDRSDRIGGGVLLAVRNNIFNLRRKDLESDITEMLACEIRPKSKKKMLVLVFYRPPNTNLDYIKPFKKALTLASKAKFDSLIVCGDFNLPHIDWSTGVATNNDPIHNFLTKIVKDNYLWQLVDFPTRINNTLDLLLTNIPEKIMNVYMDSRTSLVQITHS